MQLEFKPVVLDVTSGDSAGMLISHRGALLAIAAKLSALHDEHAGWWFVEIIFNSDIKAPRDPFPDIQALDLWLNSQVS